MTQSSRDLAIQPLELDDQRLDNVVFEAIADGPDDDVGGNSVGDLGGAAALTSGLIKRRRSTAADLGGAPDLIAYWSALRRGEAMPAPGELDAHHVARYWTGSVLMRIAGGSPVLARRYGPSPVAQDAGVAATMQIQWIQRLTREVATAGCPLQDKTTFPAGTIGVGVTRCTAIGVPLSSYGTSGNAADHVLCWVRAEV